MHYLNMHAILYMELYPYLKCDKGKIYSINFPL